MSETKQKRIALINRICALLMIVMVALQFAPFWHYGEETETSVSINGYVWMPTEHNDLTKHLKETISPEFTVEQIIGAPIIQLLTGAAGAAICLVMARKAFACLLPAACGLAGVVGYLTEPALQLGAGWGFHLALSAAILLLAILSAAVWLKKEA